MKQRINNIIGAMPFLSAAILENTEQIIMLILGTISFLLSIIISAINLYEKYKTNRLEIKDFKKEIEKLERKIPKK